MCYLICYHIIWNWPVKVFPCLIPDLLRRERPDPPPERRVLRGRGRLRDRGRGRRDGLHRHNAAHPPRLRPRGQGGRAEDVARRASLFHRRRDAHRGGRWVNFVSGPYVEPG